MPREQYPAARPRDPWAGATLTDRFASFHTTGGFVTLGDTMADVIRFAGRPDRIEIRVRTFGAVVSLTDELARDEDPVTLASGENWEPGITARVVRARNSAAGSNATIQVIGKYFQPCGGRDSVAG